MERTKFVDTCGQSHFYKVYPKSKWDSPVGYFMCNSMNIMDIILIKYIDYVYRF